MTTLLLIRHGENDVMYRRLAGRLPEVHLNAKGRQQAETLAQALANVPLQAIYSSPLERAVETAEPLARIHNLTVQIRPELAEVNYGAFQGRTYKQLQRLKLWKQLQEDPSEVRFPGGETLREVQQRVMNELSGLSNGSEEIIACVAHGDIVRLAVAYYLGVALKDFQRLHIHPASVSVVHLKDHQAKILHVNQVFHFEWPQEKKDHKPRQ